MTNQERHRWLRARAALVACLSVGLVGCRTHPSALDGGSVDAGLVDAGSSFDAGDEFADVRASIQAVLDDVPVAGVAIGVARGNDIVWLAGFGQANPHLHLPATPDTPFAIASVTKTIVTVAVLQLAERGQLNLDDDVGHLSASLAQVRNPAFPNTAITPRMLLTHTSTLWDQPFTFDATYVTAGDAPTPMADFVTGYFDSTSPYSGGVDKWWTDGPPGAFSCYSNMGFGVLGVLVEKVSGQSLEDYVQANIFRPLGMSRTSFRVDHYGTPTPIARGVRPTDAGFIDDNLGAPGGQPEGHPELASGMLKTSAHDLLRFAMALGNSGELEGARVLRADTVSMMLTRQLDAGVLTCGDGRSDPAQQALGLTHAPDLVGDWAGHYGGMNGVTASMWLLPDGQLRYVVLMNQLDLAAMGRIEPALLKRFSAH